jgi:hypothetical protein
MSLIVLTLAILVLIALLTAAGAFAWFVFRLADALPQRADELSTRLDAVRAVNELRDRLDEFDDEIASVRGYVEIVDRFGANTAGHQEQESQKVHELGERVEALDLRLQRVVATISGTGLVRFENDGEPR